MINLERRIGEAFLVLQVRQSERTTAEEVRLTQMELEQQLGGLFSLLTVEFLVPYLDRTLHILQRNKELPKIPKDVVKPAIIAGVNALGRSSDQEALVMFAQSLSQTVGPELMVKHIDPGEYIKRLAAAQGIDALNLIKSPETMQQEKQIQQQDFQTQQLAENVGSFANSPMADPSKNPAIGRLLNDGYDQLQNANNQGQQAPTGQEEAPAEG